MDEYEKLRDAITSIKNARRCIRENKGYDKELARDAYMSEVSDELLPAVVSAVDAMLTEIPAEEVERFAVRLEKRLIKLGLLKMDGS